MRLHIYVNGLERDIPEHLTDINPPDTAHLMQIIRQTISFLKLNAKVEKIMTKIQQSSFFWSSTEPIDLNTNNTVNISDIKDDIYVYLNTSYGGTRRKRRRRRTRR